MRRTLGMLTSKVASFVLAVLFGQIVALRGHCVGTAWTLRAHCVHLLGNSPKITCHLFASTANQQSPQDNNQHMRGHMGPRAIRGVANLAPNTKLGEAQQDAIAPPNIAIPVVPTGS